jgi:hypothetical protein
MEIIRKLLRKSKKSKNRLNENIVNPIIQCRLNANNSALNEFKKQLSEEDKKKFEEIEQKSIQIIESNNLNDLPTLQVPKTITNKYRSILEKIKKYLSIIDIEKIKKNKMGLRVYKLLINYLKECGIKINNTKNNNKSKLLQGGNDQGVLLMGFSIYTLLIACCITVGICCPVLLCMLIMHIIASCGCCVSSNSNTPNETFTRRQSNITINSSKQNEDKELFSEVSSKQKTHPINDAIFLSINKVESYNQNVLKSLKKMYSN